MSAIDAMRLRAGTTKRWKGCGETLQSHYVPRPRNM